ncbi:hypothetical protein AVEN_227226-1, partial [Araneus ventricosus]
IIKDYKLFMVVGVLVMIDVIILTTWQIIDPFYRKTTTEKEVERVRKLLATVQTDEYPDLCNEDNGPDDGLELIFSDHENFCDNKTKSEVDRDSGNEDENNLKLFSSKEGIGWRKTKFRIEFQFGVIPSPLAVLTFAKEARVLSVKTNYSSEEKVTWGDIR